VNAVAVDGVEVMGIQAPTDSRWCAGRISVALGRARLSSRSTL
jgi:hypothetical protein